MSDMNDREPILPLILKGGLAGFAATVPMTLVMVAGHSLLPWHEKYPLPPRQIVESVAEHAGVRKQTSETQRQAMTIAAHFGFGAATGGLYAPIASRISIPPVLGGMGYGFLVWLASYMGWLPAAHILPPASDHPARRNILMIAAHLVWGAALALIIQRQESNS